MVVSFDKIKKFIDKKKDSKNCLKKMQSDAQNSFYCVLKVRSISCIFLCKFIKEGGRYAKVYFKKGDYVLNYSLFGSNINIFCYEYGSGRAVLV